MNDAEAEAVLLALGEVLTWKNDTTKSDWPGIRLKGTVERHSYDLWVGTEGSYHVCCGEPAYVEHTQGYPSLTAAKIACERHYATGTWE